jgi:threonine dehydratase
MESMGATVEKVPGEQLLAAVATCIAEEKRVLIHPFDDVDIIRGHASCGLEILEDQPDVDVVVVCCGGGGLLAGVAAAIKLSGSSATVIGVEPTGTPPTRPEQHLVLLRTTERRVLQARRRCT